MTVRREYREAGACKEGCDRRRCVDGRAEPYMVARPSSSRAAAGRRSQMRGETAAEGDALNEDDKRRCRRLMMVAMPQVSRSGR